MIPVKERQPNRAVRELDPDELDDELDYELDYELDFENGLRSPLPHHRVISFLQTNPTVLSYMGGILGLWGLHLNKLQKTRIDEGLQTMFETSARNHKTPVTHP